MGVCKPGFASPTCTAPQLVTGDDLAFPGNGALAAVAKDTIPGYPTIHAAAHVNDGYYGNGASWIGNTSASWIKIDLGQPTRFERLTLGRDRTGQYDDCDPGRIRVLSRRRTTPTRTGTRATTPPSTRWSSTRPPPASPAAPIAR